jgi:hypothetical protein
MTTTAHTVLPRLDRRLARGYFHRRIEQLQEIIDSTRVFGKRYNEAVDELEEIGEIIGEPVS